MNKNVVKYKQFFEFSRHSPGLNLTLLEFYITVCILVNQYQNDIDFSLFLYKASEKGKSSLLPFEMLFARSIRYFRIRIAR